MEQKYIPVLLLKTQSSPVDAYEELFNESRLPDDRTFSPQFIPVLHHKFNENGTSIVQKLLCEEKISSDTDCSYGGFIFTSQRAVEAFADVSERIDEKKWQKLRDIPVYSVGPATTRALSAIRPNQPLQIFGQHTGNGEALAHFILEHYRSWYHDKFIENLPPLLFLVGEQRRDIIPRTLMDPSLPDRHRIHVTEEVVYETKTMASFQTNFDGVLLSDTFKSARSRWVVVFSPTGCDDMLRGLGMLDETTNMAIPSQRSQGIYVATIGPTTRDFLIDTFGFSPDVCAQAPTPSSVLEGISEFEASH